MHEGSLSAVCLPRPAAAAAIRKAWDAGQAVLPLDPRAPDADRARTLEALRPTHLVDTDGRRALPGGVPVDPHVAAVAATSGATGTPRGVELTWRGLRASAAGVGESLGVGPGDGWLCCLPLHHVGGLAVVARSWASGLPLAVADDFGLVGDFGPGAAAGGSTLVSLVATMLKRALDAGTDLSRFRRVVLGGGPLQPALVGRAEAAGTTVVQTYGMTETWGGVVHDGHPLVGAELRVDGDHDGAGEILVRGPMVMAGYRLRPDDTRRAFTVDGWLRTGDIGALDGGGRLTVTDRLRDLVITGGVNVSPTEVEAVLARHPDVADVCVAGRPDPEWGERVVAYVVPRDPAAPPGLAALRAHAAPALAGPKLPREVVVVDSIPRTPTGKPRRQLVRRTGVEG